MGLEVSAFIHQLVATNPVGATDPKSQGDDHIRLIKASILGTFPNITGAVTATHTQLNILATDGAGAGMLADIAAIADPNADKLLGWDDSASAAIGFALTAPLAFNGTNLQITDAAGIVTDLAALADPGVDKLLGWDESADAAIGFTFSTGLTSSGTTILIDTAVVPRLGSANSFTADITLAKATPKLILNETNGSQFTAIQFQDGAAHRGYVGMQTGADQFITGTAADTVAITSTAGIVLSGDGAAAHFALSSSGVLTTPNVNSQEVGFKGIPNIGVTSSDYSAWALGNSGMSAGYSGSGGNTFTIPANGSVAYPVGTILTIWNEGSGSLSIAITSDTMRLAGTGATGTRTLASWGVASLTKIAATVWLISGTGLS